MAAAPPSYESERRRALRLALAVTTAFAYIQVVPWPLSFLAPVAALVFTQESRAMSFADGARVLLLFALGLTGGFLLTLLFRDYPIVMVIVFTMLIRQFFMIILAAADHLAVAISVLLGTTIVPVVTILLPELGYLLVVYATFGFVVGWFIAAVAFLIIPALEQVPETHGHGSIDPADLSFISTQLALVMGTLLVAYLVFGWTDVLVLVYAGLFATALGTAGATGMGLTYIRANFVYGALATLIVFELLTIVSFLPFAVLVFFLAIYIFGKNLFSHSPTAAEWASGSFGFTILLSGLLASDKISATDKIFDRLAALALAMVYIAFVFVLLEYLRKRKAYRRVQA